MSLKVFQIWSEFHMNYKNEVIFNPADVFCVQAAIRRLRPLNPVSLSISSRTDTGVHALSNSAHFDLERRNDKPPFTEEVLVTALNFHLRNEQIRWVKSLQVTEIITKARVEATHREMQIVDPKNFCSSFREMDKNHFDLISVVLFTVVQCRWWMPPVI